MAYILTEVAEFVGTITLDHERRRNALSQPLVEEVITALHVFRDARVRVVILRAKSGAKVFSAGHDIDELPESRRDPLGWDDPLRQLVREIENFPGPVIAMVEGGVWGGATETVFACDLIIAADTATFAVTPAKLGVPYNVGGMLTLLNTTGLRTWTSGSCAAWTGAGPEPGRPVSRTGPVLPAHAPRRRGGGRGSEASLGGLFQDQLVEGEIRDSPAQPGILSLELFQALDLVALEVAVLGSPAVVGDLRHANRADRLGHGPAPRRQNIRLPQLDDNLFRRVSLLAHLSVLHSA